MRRIVTAFTAAALALSLVAQATPASALTAGYDSSYAGESAFLTLTQGQSGTFTVFFLNTGQTTWTKGSGSTTQVDLAACLEDKVTCNAQDASEAPFNSGWLSATRYASSTQSTVGPGQVGTFTYNVLVPTGQAAGTYRFNGDLVKADTGDRIHPEGYFQDVTVPAGVVAGPIVVTPTDAATNQVSGATTATANRGARSYTATITGLTGCVDIALITQARVSSDGTRFRDTGGNDPATPDNLADNYAGTSAVIEVVQGVATAGTDDFVDCVTIPADGKITFSIDSTVVGQDVKPIVSQDTNNNNNLDLTGTADSSGFRTPSEQFGVGGRKTWIAAQADAFGGNLVGSVCRVDKTANQFSTDTGGPVTADTGTTVGSAADTTPSSSECDVSFTYDSNDAFFVDGVPVSETTFEAELSRADEMSAGPYATEAAAQSTFKITNDTPDAATITCTVGTSGAATDDVTVNVNPTRPEFSDTFNIYTSFILQRRLSAQTPAASFVTVQTSAADADTSSTDTWQIKDSDVAAGTYDYRVRGVVDADEGNNSASCTVTTAAPGATGPAPTSSDVFINISGGLTNQLDTGDKVTIVFSEVMESSSVGDVIQVQDADGTTMTIRCDAATAPAAGDFGAVCTFNTATENVKGTNFDAGRVLSVVITGNANPSATSQAGTVAGMQLPSTIIDQGGIKDLTGDNWNITGSPDRVIDIE